MEDGDDDDNDDDDETTLMAARRMGREASDFAGWQGGSAGKLGAHNVVPRKWRLRSAAPRLCCLL
jgi:hypothetical protein